jgi:thiol-disulfide isomerase/thioredoxin
MKCRFSIVALLAAALTVTAAAQSKKIGLGDAAPPLSVAKWLKGTPVTSLKGKVNVVEFWATWCGPCKDSIPHLTKLAKKYKGKVNFTGVSVMEVEPGKTDPKYIAKVSDFVKKMGKSMDYNVAVDKSDNVMAKTWLEAAEQDGIPTAFVINKEGKIAWIGHPQGDLDAVLTKVLAGKYDIEEEKERKEKVEEEVEEREKRFRPLQEAVASNDERAIVRELDKLFVWDPRLELPYGTLKFEMLLVADEPAAYTYGRKLADGLYKNEPSMLNNMAWEIVDDANKMQNPDYALAIYIAEKAVALSKSADPHSLDTLALAYFKSGDMTKGIATQEKAVSLAMKDKSVDKEILEEMKKRLETMKKKAGKA